MVIRAFSRLNNGQLSLIWNDNREVVIGDLTGRNIFLQLSGLVSWLLTLMRLLILDGQPQRHLAFLVLTMAHVNVTVLRILLTNNIDYTVRCTWGFIDLRVFDALSIDFLMIDLVVTVPAALTGTALRHVLQATLSLLLLDELRINARRIHR